MSVLDALPDPAQHLSREERRAFTSAMLHRAATTSDPQARAEIIDDVILANVCVARSIASRYRFRGIPTEDLEQVANAALVRAAHQFDDHLATDFLTYAVPSIRGELRRYFRDSGWMVRPPRRIQELQTRVLEVRDRLRAETGRPSTDAQIARELDVPEADVVEALCAEGCFVPTSLDSPVGEESSASLGELIPDPRDGSDLSAAEARVLLRPVVRRLSPRDQELVRRRFFDERSQQEIADEFGVTQTQVSRLLSRVMRDLRDGLVGAGAAAEQSSPQHYQEAVRP